MKTSQILPQWLESERFDVIDISMPISSRSACFPGDVPFSKQVTLTHKESKVINLMALTMSPHVGTHVDSPLHVKGEIDSAKDAVGQMPLHPFIGPAHVIDVADMTSAIEPLHVSSVFKEEEEWPKRILFKTSKAIRYEVFENEYAYFSEELIDFLAKRKVFLVGIDTPSVDHIRSKSLGAHHRLLEKNMVWIENLALFHVKPGRYFLIALPLKFTELEASPVRAVLLNPK
jgi:arylformamidase